MGWNSFKVIIATIAIFLLVGEAYGQQVDPIQRRDNTWYGNNYFTKTLIPTVLVADLPAAGTTITSERWVSDGANDADCETGGGSSLVKCYDDGANWIAITGAGSTPTLSQVMASGNSYFSANSPSSAFQMGTSSSYIAIYDDATEGPKVICVISGVVGNCDRNFKLNSGYKFQISDSSGQPVWRLTESTGLVTYPTASKAPKKTVYIDAAGFSADGTNCSDPAEAALNTSKPKTWSITCTDNDSSRIEAKVTMPASWDGGTIRVRPSWFSQDSVATNIVQQWSGQCVRDGDAVANVSTTGEQSATLTFESEANETQKAFTAAITLNGTCAGGATIFLIGDIDATGTTYATMANARFLGAQLEYAVTGNSD